MEQIFPSQHVLSIYYHYYTLSDGCLEHITAPNCHPGMIGESARLHKNNFARVQVIFNIFKMQVYINLAENSGI